MLARILWGAAVVAAAFGLRSMPRFAAGEGAPETDLSAPGPEHEKLGALAGDWDVKLSIPVGPGRRVEGAATCESRWALDGRFVRMEYASTFGGKPLTVLRYVGFDRHKRKFVEVHFESTHTDVMNGEGSLSEDGKTIACEGTFVDGASGRPMKVRTVTTLSSRDAFTLEMTYVDSDGRDAKSITLSHARRKG